MSNTTANMGFKHIGFLPGYAPDYQLQNRKVSSANATAIFRGDPVVISSGMIVAASNATAQVDAIFDGCTFTDSNGATKWQPFCPASQTATAYVIAAPGAMFLAQAVQTSIAQANVNKNVGLALAAGSGSTTGGGFSAYGIDQGTQTTNSALPFRIVALFSDFSPSGTNGTDNTTNNNMAVVTFNSQSFKAGQTGV